MPLVSFYTPWKYQKISDEMGWNGMKWVNEKFNIVQELRLSTFVIYSSNTNYKISITLGFLSFHNILHMYWQ